MIQKMATVIFACHFLLACATIRCEVIKESMMHIQEEVINFTTFKHQTNIENGAKTEFFFIQNKPVAAQEFEKALLEAENEESKRARKNHQETEIRRYETSYKGHLKVAQNGLKKVVSQLEHELGRLSDDRLKQFFIFSPTTLASEEQIGSLKDKIAHAKKLCTDSSEATNLKKIQEIRAELAPYIARVRDMFIETVNNGINKADDTKLLKELLAFL